MKNLFTLQISFFIIFFHISSFSIGQRGDWRWAKAAGGILNDVCNSITTDSAGNVYIAGYYKSDSMNIGNAALLNDSSPSADIFISKYDGSGNLLWANRAGGTGIDIASTIVSDANGNIYLTGTFNSALLHFGNILLTNPSAGSFDIFIAKYDSAGHALWAKSAGGMGDDVANSLFVDRNSNLYITGYFYSDSIALGNSILRNTGSTSDDIFSAKMDSSGNILWAKSAGGTNEDVGSGICVDNDFNVYVTGYFLSYTISFGANNLTNASMNNGDIFTVKYDSSGNIRWVKRAGSINDDAANAICADAQGNIYITGVFFSPTITFGSNSLNSLGGGDVFVVKYDSAGNALWANSGGGTEYDNPLSITSDLACNIYLTGYFTSQTFTLGSITLNNLGAVGDDLFVNKEDSSGNILWTVTDGGNLDDWGLSINCDADDNLYVVGGTYSSSIDFGTINLMNPHYDNFNTDIWFGKLDRTTGILENNNFNYTIHLFPDPVSSYLNVYYSTENVKTNALIEIYNSLGENIKNLNPDFNQNGKEMKASIDVSDLARGIYFISVHELNGVRTGKFIKE